MITLATKHRVIDKFVYYVNTNEILCELFRQNVKYCLQRGQGIKVGVASLLILKCRTQKSFYTSAKANNSKAFEPEQEGCFSDQERWRRSPRPRKICIRDEHVAANKRKCIPGSCPSRA